jgi:hypothetical protein
MCQGAHYSALPTSRRSRRRATTDPRLDGDDEPNRDDECAASPHQEDDGRFHQDEGASSNQDKDASFNDLLTPGAIHDPSGDGVDLFNHSAIPPLPGDQDDDRFHQDEGASSNQDEDARFNDLLTLGAIYDPSGDGVDLFDHSEITPLPGDQEWSAWFDAYFEEVVDKAWLP